MINTTVLVVIGAFQAAFIVAMLTVLMAASRRGRRGDKEEVTATSMLRAPTRALVLAKDRGEELAAALGRLPRKVAVRQLLLIAGSQLADEQRASLAARVRNERWVEDTLAGGFSRVWWKRMDAARLLTFVMGPGDAALLRRLVQDPHPAVMSAAAGAIAGIADAELMKTVIRRLSKCASTVRQQQMRALRSHSELATAILITELKAEKSAAQICALVLLAEVLGSTEALAATVALASHEKAEVRATVARALRACFTPEAVDAARTLLQDDDWRVRAAAARALGSLKVVDAIGPLQSALRDGSWWVRFRSALALGALGGVGEEALATAAISDDDFARDMAVVVGGLTESARLELSS
ncbi:MAG: HEAT repeat domain-containing protein [Gemmatimonadaceae bacterium]|nr:HEAT repeat domain-containing protein [Gemmatimonadaceae bacterium]MBA3645886.1 HEAT repeat domain-containing protein [Gemmatimonadaceae bacterium]